MQRRVGLSRLKRKGIKRSVLFPEQGMEEKKEKKKKRERERGKENEGEEKTKN